MKHLAGITTKKNQRESIENLEFEDIVEATDRKLEVAIEAWAEALALRTNK